MSHTVESTIVTTQIVPNIEDGIVMTKRPEPRFLMWVDAVGGYLVCLSDEVVIGQAVPDSNADVRIFGDMSRRHATLKRYSEEYLVIPHAHTKVDRRPINGPQPVRDGDEIEFGSTVVMRFRQPHPMSATCRLEFISHHRTQPFADGVLVMANSCILGPTISNHVVCRKWRKDVMLVRQGQFLRCHGPAGTTVDGKPAGARAEISFDSRICGEDFCISLERIG
jgi:hypothetical protein